jgi:membrane protein YdbS with pleckstrin-like domain
VVAAALVSHDGPSATWQVTTLQAAAAALVASFAAAVGAVFVLPEYLVGALTLAMVVTLVATLVVVLFVGWRGVEAALSYLPNEPGSRG